MEMRSLYLAENIRKSEATENNIVVTMVMSNFDYYTKI